MDEEYFGHTLDVWEQRRVASVNWKKLADDPDQPCIVREEAREALKEFEADCNRIRSRIECILPHYAVATSGDDVRMLLEAYVRWAIAALGVDHPFTAKLSAISSLSRSDPLK